MGLMTPSKIDSLGLVSIFVLGASLYAGFFLHDERVEFEVDGRQIVADAGNRILPVHGSTACRPLR